MGFDCWIGYKEIKRGIEKGRPGRENVNIYFPFFLKYKKIVGLRMRK